MPRSLQWILDHQDELADRAEGLDPDDLVDVSTTEMLLRRAAWKRAQAERDVVEAVAEAREDGVSWNAIGNVLGTSAQAAQKRYKVVVSIRSSSTHGDTPKRRASPARPKKAAAKRASGHAGGIAAKGRTTRRPLAR